MTYKRIELSTYKSEHVSPDGYELDPTEKYLLVNFEKEIEFQSNIMMTFQIMGTPPALVNYHSWLFENGFKVDSPNPSNEFVAKYYGVAPLWRTDYSQGIVVKAESHDDYFIVMECSSKNKGYKHARIVLTIAGCL